MNKTQSWIDYDMVVYMRRGLTVKMPIKVPIYFDPVTGEEMMTAEAIRIIEQIKKFAKK